MEFKTPWLLALLPAVMLCVWYARTRRPPEALKFSSLEVLQGLKGSWKMKFGFVPFALRLAAIALMCLALAGPRKLLEESRVSTEGIDVVLALDCSGSMAAEDFEIDGKRQNRFDVVKKVVEEFIDKRAHDQIGLVAFAGRAYTVCPLTTDRSWLKANLARLHLGMLEDGTAIGSGIATSLARFKNSKAKSKVIILLTDGVSNAGSMDPLTAARTAASMNVKIYTIGAGAKGFAPFPVRDLFGRTFYQNVQIDLDEATLKKIADMTAGKYYRATDTQSLREIYKDIDRLEKSKIEHVGYKQYQELFGMFAIAVLVVLGLELVLTHTVFFKLP